MHLNLIRFFAIFHCAVSTAAKPLCSQHRLPFKYSLRRIPTCPASSPSILNANSRCTTPANFPGGISLKLGNYVNWIQEIKLTDVWIATPRRSSDVVTLGNWASRNGYNLRPRYTTLLHFLIFGKESCSNENISFVYHIVGSAITGLPSSSRVKKALAAK